MNLEPQVEDITGDWEPHTVADDESTALGDGTSPPDHELEDGGSEGYIVASDQSSEPVETSAIPAEATTCELPVLPTATLAAVEPCHIAKEYIASLHGDCRSSD
ncbi:hypothetical protein PF010_g29159 [Phytophthora fragariae]|uniref:Uncharacterized protein n=2 Tax=Phytophthora TaxID=4783 RepID=A0A6A3RRZ8_9STRA|nr:hypothetical protein PF003_g14243 [Phytophthora fragariae]KAE9028019.1 hypothetical protein PR002_g10522 [Phytophthora rubi]KAE8934115.1 hypothetical protein PF009_g15900 [Phytophthora fragariae]KAE8964472.1 hypothetical protein PF011_g28650 [Phytophthora fragariae]KAE9063021.1 hypothetical protein PF010_g29159 [Phytophthora fragariae]